MRLSVAVSLLALAAGACQGCQGRPEPVMPKEPVRTPTPRQRPPAGMPATAPDAAARLPAEVPAKTVEVAVSPAAPGGGGQTLETDVRATLENWRDAWQRKALDTYISFYAPDFLGDGMDLPRWAARKRDVFARAGDLAVGIEDLVVRPAPEGAIAEFTQTYSSGALSDRGAKTLLLRRVEGQWRILRESFRKLR